MGYDSVKERKLSHGVLLITYAYGRGRAAKVVVDRDFLFDEARRKSGLVKSDIRHQDPEISPRIIEAVKACSRIGVETVSAMGVDETFFFDEDSRWYGVHVPAVFVDEAEKALEAAELHGDASLIWKLAQRITTWSTHRSANPTDIADVLCCPCHAGSVPSHAKRGWHRNKGPWPLLSARHEKHTGQALPSGVLHLPRWADHTYRIRLMDGRWCYIAEPYELQEDALTDLAFLADSGFEITLTAWGARHQPGQTTAIEMTAPEDEDSKKWVAMRYGDE